MSPPPLFPSPRLVERPWGGTALSRWGKPVPAGARIGESWDVACVAGVESPLRGIGGPPGWATLGEALRRDGERLFGLRAAEFPLLVKLLDAQELLSVQVHPATSGPGFSAKTECWYVLEAPPDGWLYAGLREGVAAAEAVDRLAGGEVANVLDRVAVEAGDLVLVPGGTPHAITPGMVVAEIQQSSDTTYRIWDWGRVGLDGLPRALHVEAARGATVARRGAQLRMRPRRVEQGELLCATPFFAVARRRPERLEPDTSARFRIVVCVEGACSARWGKVAHTLAPGDCALLPIGCEATLDGGTILDVWVPDLERDVVEAVVDAGGSIADAMALGPGFWAEARR